MCPTTLQGAPAKESGEATEHGPAAERSSAIGEEQAGLKLFPKSPARNLPATMTARSAGIHRPFAVHKATLSKTSLAVTLLNQNSEVQGGRIRHEEITTAGEPLTATALAKAFPRQQTSCQIDFDLINLFWGLPAAWCCRGRSGTRRLPPNRRQRGNILNRDVLPPGALKAPECWKRGSYISAIY